MARILQVNMSVEDASYIRRMLLEYPTAGYNDIFNRFAGAIREAGLVEKGQPGSSTLLDAAREAIYDAMPVEKLNALLEQTIREAVMEKIDWNILNRVPEVVLKDMVQAETRKSIAEMMDGVKENGRFVGMVRQEIKRQIAARLHVDAALGPADAMAGSASGQ